jgi:glycosyltransferase involved in cell wall biosynthesis
MIVANSDWLLYHFRLPLLKSLEGEGLELILVCPEGKYVDSLKAEGYRWLPWKMDRKSTSPLKVATALATLVQYYWKYKPEAVHHITIQPIFYGSIAARILSVPVVINNFTGLGYLFSESESAFWLRKITLPILRWATAGERNYTVLLNDQDREELLARKLISEERSRVIPGDGVDLDRFHPPRERSEKPDGVVVLMAARLLWDKGVAEYVEVAAALSGDHNQVQFWLGVFTGGSCGGIAAGRHRSGGLPDGRQEGGEWVFDSPRECGDFA